ncbi:MAG: hypothetical protein AMS18_13695 [Gemmatimonas sp. SG8_17]|nr:MAG: hypothetical protein AMS18_13695 [Gemmatimonas sp. SG8_17]
MAGMVTALSGVLLSCDSGPHAGELAFELVSPVGDDRAIMFEVTALEPFTVEGLTAACTGCQGFWHKPSDTRLKGILIGPLGSGPIGRVSVSDVGDRAAYTLTLLDVAGPDLELRPAADRSLQFLRR